MALKGYQTQQYQLQGQFQSVENHRKECHLFWLCLRHAVILILKVRTSASKNTRDGVVPNSNSLEYCVQKNEGKILRFLAD